MASSTRAPGTLQLPFDVWYHIATFIPNNQMRKLYSVNQAFFRIFMLRKYHHVSTFNWAPTSRDEIQKWRVISKNPSFCRHVRSFDLTHHTYSLPHDWFYTKFNLCQGPVPEGNSQYPKTSRTFPSRSMLGFFRLFTREGKEERKLIRKWRRCVGSLNHLTDFNFAWPFLDSAPSLSNSLLLPGWKTFGPTLSSFSLSVPVELLSQVLTPSLQLERLESFSLDIQRLISNPENSQVVLDNVKVLAPFIKRHSKTLRGLTLNSHTDLPMSIFRDVGFLPNLTRLDISHPRRVRAGPAQAFQAFLYSHRDNLTDIKFNFLRTRDKHPPDYTEWFDQTFHLISNLQTVELRFWETPSLLYPIETNLASYLALHSHTLTKLSIPHPTLAFWQVQRFLDAFARNTESVSNLRELSIDIGVLTTEFFPTIAAKLPLLRELNVGYSDIEQCEGSTRFSSWISPDDFGTKMRSPLLDHWSLETLGIWCRHDITFLEDLQGIECCVVRNIPGVKIINGLSREEYMHQHRAHY